VTSVGSSNFQGSGEYKQMADEVREIIKTALDENKLVSHDVVEFNKHLGNPDFSIKAVKDVFEANNDSATITRPEA
jgi:hypothetical protein